MTWGWVNNDRIFNLGWGISLTPQAKGNYFIKPMMKFESIWPELSLFLFWTILPDMEQYNETSSAIKSTHIILYVLLVQQLLYVDCVSLSWMVIKTDLPFQWYMAPGATGVCIAQRDDDNASLNYPSVLRSKTELVFLVPFLGNQTAWSRKTPSLLISSTLWTPLTWCWRHYIVTGDELTVSFPHSNRV